MYESWRERLRLERSGCFRGTLQGSVGVPACGLALAELWLVASYRLQHHQQQYTCVYHYLSSVVLSDYAMSKIPDRMALYNIKLLCHRCSSCFCHVKLKVVELLSSLVDYNKVGLNMLKLCLSFRELPFNTVPLRGSCSSGNWKINSFFT